MTDTHPQLVLSTFDPDDLDPNLPAHRTELVLRTLRNYKRNGGECTSPAIEDLITTLYRLAGIKERDF